MSTTKKDSTSIIDKLNELDQKLQTKINELPTNSLGIEKIDYQAPTDDEIISIAKSSLETKYADSQEKAKSDFDTKKLTLSESIEKALKAAEESKAVAKKDYSASKDSIENQVLKRGLARSSVAAQELGALERQKQESLSSINGAVDSTVAKLNDEINSLETKLGEALNKLDMQYAVELNEQIEKLKDERFAKQLEALKFNNDVAEKEYKMQTGNEAKEYQQAVRSLEYDIAKEKTEAVLDYYLSYEDINEAINDFIRNKEIRDALGKNFNQVYDILKNAK